MNSKTAKLLSRAAVSLSLIGVANAQADGAGWDPQQRQKILGLTINRTQRNLKAQWNGTPRNLRGVLRTKLQNVVDRTKQSLQKGMAKCN